MTRYDIILGKKIKEKKKTSPQSFDYIKELFKLGPRAQYNPHNYGMKCDSEIVLTREEIDRRMHQVAFERGNISQLLPGATIDLNPMTNCYVIRWEYNGQTFAYSVPAEAVMAYGLMVPENRVGP